MALISGEFFKEFQISTDNTTANLQELKDNLIGDVQYNRGALFAERTAAGDAYTNYEPIKPNPRVTCTFQADVAANKAMALVFTPSTEYVRKFTFTIEVDAVAKLGLKVSGDCRIESPDWGQTFNTGFSQVTCTLISAGTAWVTTTNTT